MSQYVRAAMSRGGVLVGCVLAAVLAGVMGQMGPCGLDPPQPPGPNDVPGALCWDLNGNGAQDPEEDLNGDGSVDVQDCRGPAGQPGAPWLLNGTSAYYTEGNVGIGTDAPESPLEVTGVVHSTAGGFRFPDGTVQTTAAAGGPGGPGAWTVTGSDIFYTGGNVGIGTSGSFQGLPDIMRATSATLPLGDWWSCAASRTTGKIYCFVRTNSASASGVAVFEFDPATQTLLRKTAVLPQLGWGLACAEDPMSGRIYCFGGTEFSGHETRLDLIVEYDPTTDTAVTKNARLPAPSVLHACAASPTTGKIYCIGGNTGITPDAATMLSTIVEYDPSTDTVVTRSARLPSGREGLGCAADPVSGRIYCFGGFTPGVFSLDEIVEYDPATDTVATKVARLPIAVDSAACAADPRTGKIYCFGARTGAGSSEKIVEYDPASDTATERPTVLPADVFVPACAADANTGRIYCIGTRNPAGRAGPADVLVFDSLAPVPTPARLQVGDPGDGSGALSNAWNVFSSRAFKRDIAALRTPDYQAVLEKVKSTDVVRFRYRNDATGALRLGVIAEDSPSEILAPGGKAVSLPDYNAFLLAAIKAQQAVIEQKSQRLAELEARLTRVESLLHSSDDVPVERTP